MASRPISSAPVLAREVTSFPGILRGRSDRRAAVRACLLLAAATALAIPAYHQMLPTYEYVLGRPLAPLYAFLGAAPAVVLTGAGLLAWRSHPSSRIGPLLVLEGLLWNIGLITFASSYLPATTEIGALTAYLSYAVGGHILLSYPTGRLAGRRDHILTVLLYVVFGPALVFCFVFHGDFGPGCPLSPANAFLITPNDTLDVGLNSAWGALAGVLMALTGLRSVPRWRAATPVARRSLAPVYLTRWIYAGAITLWCASAAAVAFAYVSRVNLFLQVPVNLAAMAAAGGILVVFMRNATAGTAAGRLALDLDGAPLPAGRLEDAVRAALGDPGARLLFRDNAGGSWLDAQGMPLTPTDGRSITTFDGMSGSALEHDAAFDDDPAVVEAVGTVAGLALEAERLRVLLRAGSNGDSRGKSDARPSDGLLTPREHEVLALVSEGLTDGAIAERLYLTRRTVETHLGHVFTKLGVPSGSSQNRRVHAVRRYLEATRVGTNDRPG